MMADPARLLSSVADALNECERAGIIVDLDHGGLSCRYGYVLPNGDPRLGSRWAARAKKEPLSLADGESSDKE
jgi:hypothetical protein